MIEYIKTPLVGVLAFSLTLLSFPYTSVAQTATKPAQFVMGYYPGWVEEYNTMPLSEIDWRPLTHIAHFAAMPNGDTLDFDEFFLTKARMRAFVREAHKQNVKAMLVVGSGNSASAFRRSTTDQNIDDLVDEIVATVAEHGYDGVDIDWEPFVESDTENYQALIEKLDDALEKEDTKLQLTTAVLPTTSYAKAVDGVEKHLDYINLMTYALTGPWPGWATWHFSSVYADGTIPGSSTQYPSNENSIARFAANGVAKNKMSIGIGYYGSVWEGGSGTDTGGVTKPKQKWSVAPKINGRIISFRHIYEQLYDPSRYLFDEAAKAPYLSIDNAGSVNDKFVGYENGRSIIDKMEYVEKEGLAGVILWHLGLEYLPYESGRSKHALSDALMAKNDTQLTALATRRCSTFAPGTSVASYYAPPYTLSGSQALMLNAMCNSGAKQVTAIAGLGGGGTFVHKSGWHYQGGKWNPVTFTGFDGSKETWIEGVAKAQLPYTPGQETFFLAYICTEDSSRKSGFKCGCKDDACTKSYWQVQGIR